MAESASTRKPREPIFSTVAGEPLSLTNLYRGATAFLLCSGPSAANLDLSQLTKRGIFTLAVNNAATMVRPSAMIFVDKPSKFAFDVWRDPGVIKFCPHGLTTAYQLNRKAAAGIGEFLPTGTYPADMPSVVVYRREANFAPEQWLSEDVIGWGNDQKNSRRNKRPRFLSVFFAAIKVLYVLGFRRVVLVGADFKMDAIRPYAFAESKDAGGCSQNRNIYGKMDQCLRELRQYFDRAGFVVLNCNRESGLRAFDFVDFGQAVSEAVIQEPIDVLGMYSARSVH